MKRKDYELVIKVIRGAIMLPAEKANLVTDFVDELKKNNGNFNEQAFKKDCGIGPK